MKINILSSEDHPVNVWIQVWIKKYKNAHEVQLLHSKKDIGSGDILFLISCPEIVSKQEREKFRKTLVIHASDLPKGRGWSPHIWDIIDGAEQITLSLLEAEDVVDSGDIWTKVKINIPKTALYNQINNLIFRAELELMDFAIENFHKVEPYKQLTEETSYRIKRTPKDSEIDLNKSIGEQFNLMRICDPKRFPAFFYKDGKKFKMEIEAIDE
jgi:methionyl-tRNA formyltransferase